MLFFRTITTAAILFTLSSPAVAVDQSETICQKMVLSLLSDHGTNIPEFKQQIMFFADMCMPESAMSEQPQIYRKLKLIEDDGYIETIQARM